MTNAPDTLAVALAYAALGYRVLPLCRPVLGDDGKPLFDRDGHVACTHAARGEKCGDDPKKPDPGKIPMATIAGGGVTKATADPSTIRRWWAQAEGRLNIGLAAGPELLIIDEDTYKNEHAWEELRGACGGADLDTVVFLTGGGGRHHLYRVPADSGLTQAPPKVGGKPIRGIDVRIGNGYIVGPGSLHRSGKLYAAEASCDPLEGAVPKDAPAALVALLRGGNAPPAKAPQAAGRNRIPGEDGERLGDGQVTGVSRKLTITRHAGRLHMGGLSEAAVIAAMQTMNEDQFEPPLEAEEVARIVRTITCKPRDGRKKAEAAAPAPAHPARHAPPDGGAVGDDRPPPDPVQAGDPPDDPAQPDAPAGNGRRRLVAPFTVGDSPEVAKRLLADLRARHPEAPAPQPGDAPPDPPEIVFDLGNFWRYDGPVGIWTALEEHSCYKVVGDYSGTPILGQDDRDRILKLPHNAIVGALAAARQYAARPGFFDDRRPGDLGTVGDGVAFRNGFLTISRAGEPRLAPHSPEHRARFRIDVDFDPDAPCDAWTDFFAAVFDDSGATKATNWRDPAIAAKTEGVADILHREATCLEMVGAALFGLATRYAKCFVMLGRMAQNGKSTFLETIEEKLFARNTTCNVPPQDWGRKFALHNLVGKKLNVCGELPDRGMQESSIFKSVITGDSVNAEPKHRQAFSFRPAAAHIFSANSLPGSNDTTDGFWRRFIVVPWNRVFADEAKGDGQAKRDLDVKDRLRAQTAGLVALAVLGACRLVKNGKYTISESSREALSDWQLDADQVRAFVREWCDDVATSRDARTRLDEMYAAYVPWARENGNGVLSKSKLGVRLRELGLFHRDKSGRYYLLRISLEGASALAALEARQSRRDHGHSGTGSRAGGSTPPKNNSGV